MLNLLKHPAEASLYPEFFSAEESDIYLNYLLNDIPWIQEPITMFGKKVMQPRLTAFFGDKGMKYTYSGLTMQAEEWSAPLLQIKAKLEEKCSAKFNVCLLNHYRDGMDHMGWHRDNEQSLGSHPIIASVSFGATRIFQFRNYEEKVPVISLEVEHGSLLLMRGETQRYWEHRLTKRTVPIAPRVNLTFRFVYIK